jgi:ABC-2 type transport system ATP-binding protein
MESSYIKISNLSKSYKDVKALTDINIDISRGCLFGLIGPDGAGKTTLLRIITTLLKADKGGVRINGHDVVSDYRKIRTMVGYMPGRFSLYPDLSVEENLGFYATIFGTSISENYHLIKNIYSHIEPFNKRLARNLSGGMKQKLALSCALIHNPEILVLDEPTTGVDAVSRNEFWEILKDLSSGGMTIMVSTSYMNEAELCDKVVLMHNGIVLDNDIPERIVRRFNKSLLAVKTDNTNKLVIDLREYSQDSSAYLFGQYVHYCKETGYDEMKIRKYLMQKGHNDVEIVHIGADIEDCFISAIEKYNDLNNKEADL